MSLTRTWLLCLVPMRNYIGPNHLPMVSYSTDELMYGAAWFVMFENNVMPKTNYF